MLRVHDVKKNACWNGAGNIWSIGAFSNVQSTRWRYLEERLPRGTVLARWALFISFPLSLRRDEELRKYKEIHFEYDFWLASS